MTPEDGGRRGEREGPTETIPADAAGIARAAALLAEGGIVALPTETVYGLAADATSAAAVQRIYAAKGRPAYNPLIVHVDSPAMARRLVRVEEAAAELIRRFWPGPLTLVLPLIGPGRATPAVTAGLPSLAVRMPAHPVMRAVIAAVGRPLAAPSANRSGQLSPTTAAHVDASLGGRVPLILDGGPAAVGLESTIVAVEGGRLSLLRPGAIPAEALQLSGAPPIAISGAEQPQPTSPGQLDRHYAPVKPIRLEAVRRLPGEVLIGFGAHAGDLTLSATGDLEEAAARLFAVLHDADRSGARAIAVAPVPDVAIGRAINDRLRRAARS